jgi:Asp-tRNA(Asn)/Glu-tRNA(Gln) amidotransferase C subunit
MEYEKSGKLAQASLEEEEEDTEKFLERVAIIESYFEKIEKVRSEREERGEME